MKILAIRGRNLASLAGEFALELDQSPLAEAGLFGISGPTGAGKSTLLDALCLALFDQMPRLDDGRQGLSISGTESLKSSDPRNILTRGLGEAYAEVDFLGYDKRPYCARWELRRARGRATGRMQPQQMSLQDLEAGEYRGRTKTEVLQEIESLLGLSYTQFRRSVFLAQGDFASFLRASENERAQLLERMTGTEIYAQLSRLAYQKAQDCSRELQELQERLSAWIVLDPSERQTLEKDFKGCQAARVQLSQEAKQVQEALHWQQHRLQLEKAEKEAQEALERLGKELEAAHELREECRAVSIAQRYRQLHEEQKANQNKSHFLRELQQFCQEQREAKSFAKLYQGTQSSQALAWQNLAERYQSKAEQKAKLSQAYHELKLQLESYDKQVQKGIAKQKELENPWVEQAKELKGQELCYDEFPKAELFQALEKLSVEERGLEEREGRWKAHLLASKQKDQLFQERDLTKQQLSVRKAESQEKEAALSLCAPALREARQTLDRLKSQLDLKQWREALSDGEPCPLCGSLEHPLAHTQISQQILKEQEERIQELESRERQLSQELLQLKEQIAKQELKIQAFEQKLLHIESQLLRAPEMEEKELLIRRQELETDRKQLSARRRELQELEASLKAKRQDFALAEKAYQLACHELQALTKTRDQAENQAHSLKLELAELESALEVLLQQLDYLLAELARDLSEAQERADKKKEELQEQLDRLAWSQEQLDSYLKRDESWLERSRESLQALEKAKSQAEGRLEQAKQQLKEQQESCFESQDLKTLDEKAKEQEKELKRLEELFYTLQNRLKEDERCQLKQKELESELEARRLVAKKWQVMRELIGSADGHKFRRYAQSLTLEILTAHANRQLKEIMPRYALERISQSDLGLQVVDHDMGDEKRSVLSLSGGESFLVSLALALGLSSLAADKNQVQSLFIDEGFGALDVDSVDLAMSALENLQATGRQVAVISHLPSLIERLGTTVQVCPRGGGKSAIIPLILQDTGLCGAVAP